jgi:hypothetical protein
MSVLSPLKEEISAIVGTPCLVQRDRVGRALFFSDFPQRAGDSALARLEKAGFTVQNSGDYALIDMTPARYASFFEALITLPLPDMTNENAVQVSSCDMLRRHPCPITAQDTRQLREALLLIDAGKPSELALKMQSWLADALRDHTPVPCATAKLMLHHLQ